jgi:branched-chain amino acid aminotransferase
MEKQQFDSKLPGFPVLIYEVMRIIDGIPIFLGEHLDRLYHSARISGLNLLPGPVALRNEIEQFIQVENRKIGNIKLTFTFRESEMAPESELKFIPHKYPVKKDYQNGVQVALMNAERPVPNAKVQHNEIREKTNQLMDEKSVYEVLLVDQNNKITEGSRSNVFFIRDNMVFTAPPEKVLEGITRNKVIDLCLKNGIPVIETEIPVERLNGYTAAFLTGTSPKVLPIASVGDLNYATQLPLLQRIENLYENAIIDYIDKHKSVYE